MFNFYLLFTKSFVIAVTLTSLGKIIVSEIMQTNQNDFQQQFSADKDDIVLPDECGDSLWDKVLQPGNKCTYPAGSCENEGLPNNIIDKNNELSKDKTSITVKLTRK